MRTIGLAICGVIGFVLAFVSAILVNVAPVNSGMAWAFAVSCIVGTWMGIGAFCLICNGLCIERK